ncbi:MAG: KEOPS complex subunit Pcc1 [Candidatus Syntropharchaeia archaeon]
MEPIPILMERRVQGKIVVEHPSSHIIGRALDPDNLPGMETMIEDGRIEISFSIRGIGSVISTIDDYLMNFRIAEEICELLGGI